MILDAFAGPGGWSEALKELGRSDIGVEWDAMACATRRAAGHRTIRADVASFPIWHLNDVEGVIASPPCPSFSAAGNGSGRDELPRLLHFADSCRNGWSDPGDGWADKRTPLVLEPLRWVQALRPDWVALEQVPSVLPLWEMFAEVWREKGYRVWTGKINAADLGVPQTRIRAILMASRSRPVKHPEPTHAQYPLPSLFADALPPWVSLVDALGWAPDDEAFKMMGAGMVERHGDRPCRMGTEPAFAIRANAGGCEPGGFFRRPATTIQCDTRLGNAGHKDWDGGESQFQPDAIKLTVEEMLILQSFRPDYPLQGSKTKKVEQIGNAIPVLMAKHVLAGVING